MTQQLGRMSSKKAGGNAGRRRTNKNKSDDAQMPSDDEVDAFHKSKDRLALNVSDDDDEESEESEDDGLEDGGDLLGLSDDDESDDDDDEESDDDDDEDGNGRLAQREFVFIFLFERIQAILFYPTSGEKKSRMSTTSARADTFPI